MRRRISHLVCVLVIVVPMTGCLGTVGGAPACDPPAAADTPVAIDTLGRGDGRWARRDARWPNEPKGLNTLTDWPYDQLVSTASGAFTRGVNVWNGTRGTGLAAVVCDLSAPLSPPAVAQFTYPAGLPSGTAPWTLYFVDSPPGREFYTAFWWKASDPWEGDPSGINKITFWQDAAPASANLIVMMNNQRQRAYHLTVTLEFNDASNGHLVNVAGMGTVWHLFGNVGGGNYEVVPGTWYRVELYFKGSSTPTARDGIVRWWATKAGDAAVTQVGNYTDVNFDAPNFVQFSFAPTWGGNSGVRKRALDYYRIDHVHVSGR
jgi:hypothetical protein